MKLFANAIPLLGLLFLASACGKAQLEERTSGGPSTQSNFDAETVYRNLPAPDYTVTFNPMMFGGSATTGTTAQNTYTLLAAYRKL